MSRLILFHRGTRWSYKGTVWWTDRIEFWYDRKFKHKCLFGSDIFEWKGKKEPGFFFFLTRLLTDSLIKLSGQKKKEKTRVLFRRAMHALILSTFRNQIRNLIYKSYHFRLHADHLLFYFPSYRPLTISQTLQSFFSKDSLFWSEIDKICIAFHLTVLLCNYIRDWTRCIIFC